MGEYYLFAPLLPYSLTLLLNSMWNTIAASTIGSAHLKQNKTNEDAFALGSSLSKHLILVASDGAGSAACAAQGSAFVTQTMLKLLSELKGSASRFALECELLACLHVLQAELRIFARIQERPVKDFSATLLAAVLAPPYLLALQVGDGAIVVKDDEGTRFVTQPFHGEYASETIFVSSDDALQKASFAVLPLADIHSLALLTDGLEPVALAKNEPFVDFFDPLFAFTAKDKEPAQKCRDLQDFLASERIAARTHDDKTLILVSK